jgi:hypothetical protein
MIETQEPVVKLAAANVAAASIPHRALITIANHPSGHS